MTIFAMIQFFTYSALTTIIARSRFEQIDIVSRQWMSSFAMSFSGIYRSDCVFVNEWVLRFCHNLKVVRVNTRAIMTNMMQMFSFWYISIFQHITKTMNQNSFRVWSFIVLSWVLNLKSCVSVFLNISRPLPTSIRKYFVMLFEVLLGRVWFIFGFSVNIIFFKNVIYRAMRAFVFSCQRYCGRAVNVLVNNTAFRGFGWAISLVGFYVIPFKNVKNESKGTLPFFRQNCWGNARSIFLAYLDFLSFCKLRLCHNATIIGMGTQYVNNKINISME